MSQTAQSTPVGTADGDLYEFWLFVAGEGLNSLQAQQNLTSLCSTYLRDRCKITVFDVLKDFKQALEHRVFVTPTLVLMSPLPRVTIVGNLNDTQKVLLALRLTQGI